MAAVALYLFAQFGTCGRRVEPIHERDTATFVHPAPISVAPFDWDSLLATLDTVIIRDSVRYHDVERPTYYAVNVPLTDSARDHLIDSVRQATCDSVRTYLTADSTQHGRVDITTTVWGKMIKQGIVLTVDVEDPPQRRVEFVGTGGIVFTGKLHFEGVQAGLMAGRKVKGGLEFQNLSGVSYYSAKTSYTFGRW